MITRPRRAKCSSVCYNSRACVLIETRMTELFCERGGFECAELDALSWMRGVACAELNVRS